MGPKSLAFRLFVSAAAWTLVVMPIAAILLTSLYRQSIERNFDARLDVYMTSLVAASTAEGGDIPESPESLGAPVFDIPFSGWYWQIKPLESAARPLFVSGSLLDQELDLPSKEHVPPDDTLTRRSYAPGPDGENLRIEEREIRPGNDGVAAYSYAVGGDAAEIDADLAQFTTMLILALVILGAGLTVATFFQVRFGLLPLRAIRHDLAAIRSGDAEKLEGELPDEIKPLQTELNALIQSNRDVVERARTHVGNLAHALKTPLSVISNEARSHGGALSDKVVEQAEIMRTQITHHLDRARVAARSGVIGGVTEVEPTLMALKRALDRIYDDKGIVLTVSVGPGLKFQGEKQDFEEMTGNLIDNACKWAKGAVAVAAQRSGDGEIVVTVDDDGPGLTKAERERAVKRGQRLDESKPGSGLGLSIVADLAHLYKGRFELEKGPKGGLCARLTLPAG
ncbi:ATP-binding protein [Methyloceanibacter sp.]|uniref:ATP-binding protein n=1 Tax=Methyloceanibacter sp. TaxID=1965321 RepID=UPI00208C79EC|nr:ATP-binding protein [Methyloceanibacter sp.]GFO83627.1 MAG: ATPase [Methyloceanibacter sp.]HML91766.1 ATP-binding protein [Methyloceanibacter sp.]